MIKMDQIASAYVKLANRINLYDDGFVDAYYGPDELKVAPPPNGPVQPTASDFRAFEKEASDLLVQLKTIVPPPGEEIAQRRYRFLESILTAAKTRMVMKAGEKFPFDRESKLHYNVVAPSYTDDGFRAQLKTLGGMLPGKGDVAERFRAYREQFVLPKDRLKKLFDAGISEARLRTRKFIPLPENESFDVELMETDKGWSAYNWYKGNGKSLIQVNTKVPIYADQMILWASHEGYPGHHVQGILRERMYREKNWVEYSVVPLFTCQGVMAEGGADYGVDLAFPHKERIRFEKEVLFPLAGLDPKQAEEYIRIIEVRDQLSGQATIESARRYLDGKISKEDAVRMLMEFALEGRPRAENRGRFFDTYRSYIVNYSLGKEMIRKFVDTRVGRAPKPSARWDVLVELFATPYTPFDLV